MNFDYDHERFVAKNRSLASAEEFQKKDIDLEKKGLSPLNKHQEVSCFNCKMKQGCSEFKSKKSGGAAGVVSFGGDEKFVCSRYILAASSEKSMSSKQIRSLLKNVKNGH
jgi:hypothetical protein